MGCGRTAGPESVGLREQTHGPRSCWSRLPGAAPLPHIWPGLPGGGARLAPFSPIRQKTKKAAVKCGKLAGNQTVFSNFGVLPKIRAGVRPALWNLRWYSLREYRSGPRRACLFREGAKIPPPAGAARKREKKQDAGIHFTMAARMARITASQSVFWRPLASRAFTCSSSGRLSPTVRMPSAPVMRTSAFLLEK